MRRPRRSEDVCLILEFFFTKKTTTTVDDLIQKRDEQLLKFDTLRKCLDGFRNKISALCHQRDNFSLCLTTKELAISEDKKNIIIKKLDALNKEIDEKNNLYNELFN